MRFVGISGIDDGGNDLNSRATHPMSFTEAADWFKASCEYFAMMVEYDPTVFEAIVSIYDANDIESITTEPIARKMFRPKQ